MCEFNFNVSYRGRPLGSSFFVRIHVKRKDTEKQNFEKEKTLSEKCLRSISLSELLWPLSRGRSKAPRIKKSNPSFAPKSRPYRIQRIISPPVAGRATRFLIAVRKCNWTRFCQGIRPLCGDGPVSRLLVKRQSDQLERHGGGKQQRQSFFLLRFRVANLQHFQRRYSGWWGTFYTNCLTVVTCPSDFIRLECFLFKNAILFFFKQNGPTYAR